MFGQCMKKIHWTCHNPTCQGTSEMCRNTRFLLVHLDQRSRWTIVITFHISSFFSETTGPIRTKLSRNVPWMVLYKVTVYRSSRIFNMAAKANNMLWLAEISKIIFSEPKLYMNDHWNVLYQVTVFYADRKSKMAAIAIHRLTLDSMG